MTKEVVRCGLEEAFINDYLFIRWEINKYCNFDCSYCELHDSKKSFKTKDELFKIVDFITSFDRDIINISITGGEPFTNPNFINTISYLVNNLNYYNKKQLSIFTNLSTNYNILKELSEIINKFNGGFRLNCSYHSECISFKKFKENIRYCLDLDINIIIRFMVDSNDLSKMKNEFSILSQLNCIIIPEFVHGFNYNDEIIDWYKSLDIETQSNRMILIDYKIDGEIKREYISNDKINFYGLYKSKGFYCYVGSKHLFIKGNGGVSLCYSYDKLVGSIFNILDDPKNVIDETLKKYSKPIRCINKECYCETWVPKFIKGYEDINDS